MNHQDVYDGKSLIGSAVSLFFVFISHISITDLAGIMAMSSAGLTGIYTIIKIIKELIRRRMKQ